MLSLADIESALPIVRAAVAPTPQYAWPLLAREVGCEVWVKHENHTPIGAFKARGGLVYVHELCCGTPPARLITATRGNHGQSIPFAATSRGIAVTVFVPEGNSTEKNAAMSAWGAEVEAVGADFDAAREAAEQHAASGAGTLVPSFHEHLIRGVASYGYELFNAVADLDAVYVPIGMGSGICSLIAVRDALGARTAIVGVVSDRADAVALSVDAGRLVTTNSANTFADGVAVRVPHPDALAIIAKGAERIVRVSDDEIAEAVRILYRTTHNVAEGAGAAACAALIKERDRQSGQRVAVVLTGGNIDSAWFAEILRGNTPSPR